MSSLVAGGAMLAIAGYCAVRLVVGRRRRLSRTRLVDVSHVVMGTAMAGMFVPALMLPVPLVAWLLVFTALTIAFLPRLGRSLAAGRGAEAVMHLDHVLVGTAMLVMLAGLHISASSTTPGVVGTVPVVKMASMHHGEVRSPPAVTVGTAGGPGGGSALLVTVALVIAAYLVMAAVRQAVTAFRSARTMAAEGPGESGWFMAPTWTMCCESVMAVAMAAMLWIA